MDVVVTDVEESAIRKIDFFIPLWLDSGAWNIQISLHDKWRKPLFFSRWLRGVSVGKILVVVGYGKVAHNYIKQQSN